MTKQMTMQKALHPRDSRLYIKRKEGGSEHISIEDCMHTVIKGLMEVTQCNTEYNDGSLKQKNIHEDDK